MMREFGSDFHYISDYKQGISLVNNISGANYYANGRQAIQSIINFSRWKRIWVPLYFCYGVIDSIRRTGIEVLFYNDYPLFYNDQKCIENILFCEGDVLLRMNYFGTRSFRDNSQIPVPVIEDHSHDLLGNWAINSNADWCIASLRKTLPISEGGILWSPKKYQLPDRLVVSAENARLAQLRMEAMCLKTQYLNGDFDNKKCFRDLYVDTENQFQYLSESFISDDSYHVISTLDIKAWIIAKTRNWNYLIRNLHLDKVEILCPENSGCNIFSLVMLFDQAEDRDAIRQKLIQNCVYPAILWDIPDNLENEQVYQCSRRLLSIHCDGRYILKDIKKLSSIINYIFND